MKKNFYCGLAAFTALALSACMEDHDVSAVMPPIAVDSSSSVITISSSSAFVGFSSSSFGLSSGDTFSSSLVNSSSSSHEISSSSSFAESSASVCRALILFCSEGGGACAPVGDCAKTSCPKNVVADGRWRVMETDNADGGKSSIVWPVEFADGVDSMTAVSEYCGGICGSAVLGKGSLTYNPFVSVGFTFARDSSGNPAPVDVSDWGGICISYKSEIMPMLVLKLSDSVITDVLKYAEPQAGLPKSFSYTIKCIPWSDFKIPSWFRGDDQGWKDNPGAKAAKQLVGVEFKLQSTPTNVGYKFNIVSISAYNSGRGYACYGAN